MMKDQRGPEILACLSDPESVSLLHTANIDLYATVYEWVSVFTPLFWCPSVHCFWHAALVSPVGHRQIGWPHLLRPKWHPLQWCLGTPPPAALVTLLSVCGSSNCCKFIRLHINVVSIEPKPALLVALLVCLPVAAVTVEVERAHWLRTPQQFHCCACSHFNINGSVYLVQALFVCTIIKLLWMSWITMEWNTECVYVCL